MKTIGRRTWTEEGADPFVHANDIEVEVDPETGAAALRMVEGSDAVAQSVEAAVLTRRGEMPLNVSLGIPYFSTIFEGTATKDMWRDALRERIRALPFVDSVRTLEVTTSARGVIGYSAEIKTKDGETTTVDGELAQA